MKKEQVVEEVADTTSEAGDDKQEELEKFGWVPIEGRLYENMSVAYNILHPKVAKPPYIALTPRRVTIAVGTITDEGVIVRTLRFNKKDCRFETMRLRQIPTDYLERCTPVFTLNAGTFLED